MPTIFSKMTKPQKIGFIIFVGVLFVILLSSAYYINGTNFVVLLLFVGVGTITALIIRDKKSKLKSAIYNRPIPRRGWTEEEKERVRNRQDGKCVSCHRIPPRWEYHHRDGNRSNNSLSNCEGLCPNCHSVETHDSEE